MTFGSMANDGGNLILQPEEADFLMMKYPRLKEEGAIRPFIGSEEYINRKQRYCLWLLGIRPEVYENIPEIQRRIQAVKSFREYSPRADVYKRQEGNPRGTSGLCYLSAGGGERRHSGGERRGLRR